MRVDSEEHHRRSIRLKGYAYSSAGGYYVTVVTMRRECLFGEIENGGMRLNALGGIVREEWFKASVLRSYVQLHEEEFVVMPNHVHGIIWIMDDFVGAQRRCAPTTMTNVASRRCAPATMVNVAPRSLGAIVRAFKSAVTYRAGRELNSANIWQRNYYEHVIRGQSDYERIADYIVTNPVHWVDDDENPHKPCG